MKLSHTLRLAPMLLAVLSFAILNLGVCRSASAQIQNGGFEQPHYADQTNVHTGSTFGGWHVAAGNIDIVPAKDWKPEEGTQCIDLSGDTAGTIYQDVPTSAGQTYQVSFYMAGNTHDQPGIKSLNVLADNTRIGHFTFDTTNTSATNMGWRLTQVAFMAKSALTRITFQSLDQSTDGPALDDVSVTLVYSPSTPHAHVLWTTTSGAVSVWTILPDGTQTPSQNYGPYAGWTAKAMAEGANGSVRLLWTNTNGQMSLWNLSDARPSDTCLLYGPYTGWTATALAVGADNAAHLLWNNADGRVSLWNLNDPRPSDTCLLFGPYAGWAGQAIAIGPDNRERLLWNNASGQIALWNLGDANPAGSAVLYGPYAGWTATALAVGPDNAAHLMWNNTDGRLSLWNMADARPSDTCLLYGPYAGWSGRSIAFGSNGQERLLWDNADSRLSLWNLSDPSPASSCFVSGSNPGWTAVGISAGP